MTGQRGQVFKLGSSWAYRYHDAAAGKRPQRGGFRTKGEARLALDEQLRRQRLGGLYRPKVTLQEIVDEFFAIYSADPSTVKWMRWHAGIATAAFGDALAAELGPAEIGRWRRSLSNERSAHQTLTVLRQILGAAVKWGWIERNAASGVANPRMRRVEVSFFESWLIVEALARELGSKRDGGSIVIVGAGTGLRPEELFGLDWPDVDLKARVLTVRRVFVKNVLKPYGKTEGSRRRVPLRARVVEALEALPGDRRGSVFQGALGARVSLSNWSRRSWKPGLDAAGMPGIGESGHVTPYGMRHTYAAWSLAAGVNIFTLARRMGTSVEMINRTYGHLTEDADDVERDLLDAYDKSQAAAPETADSDPDGREVDIPCT